MLSVIFASHPSIILNIGCHKLTSTLIPTRSNLEMFSNFDSSLGLQCRMLIGNKCDVEEKVVSSEDAKV